MYLIASNNSWLYLAMLKSRKSLWDCRLCWHLSRLLWVRNMSKGLHLLRMDLCLNKAWQRMWGTSLPSNHTWIQDTSYVQSYLLYKLTYHIDITLWISHWYSYFKQHNLQGSWIWHPQLDVHVHVSCAHGNLSTILTNRSQVWPVNHIYHQSGLLHSKINQYCSWMQSYRVSGLR